MSPFFSLTEMTVLSLTCLGESFAADIFLRRYFKSTGRRETLFVLLLAGSRMLCGAVSAMFGLPYILLAFLYHMFFLALLSLFFQGEGEKKLLAGSLLILVTILTVNFCEGMLTGITLAVYHSLLGIQNPFLGEGTGLVISVISSLICMGAVLLFGRHTDSVFYGKEKRWYLILSVPLFFLTAVVDIANWGASRGITVKFAYYENLYYDQLFAHGEICVLTLLCMFAAGVYVFGMDRIYAEQLKNGRYSAQIAAYRMMEEEDKKRERLRHDMKNHVIALKGLLENREWEKMNRYLTSMEESGSLKNAGELTGNRAVDALLYRKQKLAEEKNIRWICDAEIPGECFVNEFDICVLLGNMLDNAIEGCDRLSPGAEPFLTVRVGAVKKCLLFEVKNSTDLKEKPGIGSSRKENRGEHGIGLSNVWDVAEKYNGVMQVEVENGEFLTAVLLPFHCRI